jgi:hypothetical protein
MNVSVSPFMPSRRSPAIISRRVDGFHPAHIRMFKATQQNVKVIEGTMAPPALPAPTEREQPRRKRSNRLLEHVEHAIGPSRKPQ